MHLENCLRIQASTLSLRAWYELALLRKPGTTTTPAPRPDWHIQWRRERFKI
jgi:hypothetical protein